MDSENKTLDFWGILARHTYIPKHASILKGLFDTKHYGQYADFVFEISLSFSVHSVIKYQIFKDITLL